MDVKTRTGEDLAKLHDNLSYGLKEKDKENLYELFTTLVETKKQTMEQMKSFMQREKVGDQKPRKMCQRCKKHGRHISTYSTHWTKDCTKFLADKDEAPAQSALNQGAGTKLIESTLQNKLKFDSFKTKLKFQLFSKSVFKTSTPAEKIIDSAAMNHFTPLADMDISTLVPYVDARTTWFKS